MVSEWLSVIGVSLNFGSGVHLIKKAKLYMCMQTHYKHDEDGCMAVGVRDHGSGLLIHLGERRYEYLIYTHLPSPCTG